MTHDQASATFAVAALKQAKKKAAINAFFEMAAGIDKGARAGRMATGPVAKSGARSHPAWRKHLSVTYEMQSMLHFTAACSFFALA